LDVGCGSGILGLTAARLGVPCVVGFDIDIRAVRNSIRNAETNHLGRSSHWFVGTSEVVAGNFDCVVANLPYDLICGILGDLSRLINCGGKLILSGFQDINWGPLSTLLANLGLTVKQLLSGDRSFYGIPPSGSFTWMAVLSASASAEDCRNKEGL
jgi:ribosomal protein L11 methyltransferase